MIGLDDIVELALWQRRGNREIEPFARPAVLHDDRPRGAAVRRAWISCSG
jgi:hypothetical protein